MKTTLSLLILALGLASCATRETPEPRVVTVEVSVPVPVKCIPDGYHADTSFVDTVEALLNARDAAERYQLLWAGRQQRDAAINEQRVVIEGCALPETR